MSPFDNSDTKTPTELVAESQTLQAEAKELLKKFEALNELFDKPDTDQS